MARGPIVLVFDQALGPGLAAVFKAYHEGDPHVSVAPPETIGRKVKDIDWLDGGLPKDPPHIVITKDSLLRPKAQVYAWIRGGLTVIIIDTKLANLPKHELVALLFRWWPALIATINREPRSAAFTIPASHRIQERLPTWRPWMRPRPRKGKSNRAPDKSKVKDKGIRRDKRQLSLELASAKTVNASQPAPMDDRQHEDETLAVGVSDG